MYNYFNKKMIDEAKESLKKNIEDKLVSPFWGAYIASWCAWNWKILYITFFVDSEQLLQNQNILKIDYITYLYQYNSLFNSICTISHLIILPLVTSYVIVFFFAKIDVLLLQKIIRL